MRRPRGSRVCPNCHYIGDPKLCSCQWTIRKVAEGKGADPDVVANAKTILEGRDK